MPSSIRRQTGRTIIFAATAVMLFPTAAASNTAVSDAQTVASIEFIGEVVIPTGTEFGGTEIGGLSSITYDVRRDAYHIISDDQGNRATGDPVRYYTVEADISDGSLDAGDVEFVQVRRLLSNQRAPFPPGGLDPEGIAIDERRRLFVSSEGNVLADPIIEPFIRRYDQRGRVVAHMQLPDHYLPNGVDRGVRFNLAFESLNLTPDGDTLVSAAEGALFQDGPVSTFTNGSLARILTFNLPSRTAASEYVYEVDPWAEPSAIFGVNGIVEVLPIDDVGTMLVMERSFSVGGVLGGGTGNVVIINEISTVGATDVLDMEALYEDGAPLPVTPVSQRPVFAFDDLGIPIDNIEGMTFGPDLPDGRRTLMIVSDNNFSTGQFTQFIALAVDLEPGD